jgi:guanosine-3',5'-bis(diphosphate) 3'-pyrophosphohydrolase
MKIRCTLFERPPVSDPNQLLFDAIAFAARAHKHQLRKDGQTPYVSHVVRVAFVVRHVFGFDDPKLLAAAALHDTIEDTTTDYDDLVERFGSDVAGWVAALTKDMRLPHEAREAAYGQQLINGGWPVWLCKLADIYDNLGDSVALSPSQRRGTVARSQMLLDMLRPHADTRILAAFAIVETRLASIEK